MPSHCHVTLLLLYHHGIVLQRKMIIHLKGWVHHRCAYLGIEATEHLLRHVKIRLCWLAATLNKAILLFFNITNFMQFDLDNLLRAVGCGSQMLQLTQPWWLKRRCQRLQKVFVFEYGLGQQLRFLRLIGLNVHHRLFLIHFVLLLVDIVLDFLNWTHFGCAWLTYICLLQVHYFRAAWRFVLALNL